ncbi:hypothetical protein RHMOL_Rhmol02G0240000 [Rhododendron molle]|uniref:Uncharacterized protein n=1 Tax=Rhododendron molle TaxID=49168 RepID=A0ACC0PTY9_RHOML|nr:hypothetical protein RHMOL_Rhmol02G0240000 [Rhododendron molle]
MRVKDYLEDDLRPARQLVSTLLKSAEEVEEKIEEAAERGELTKLVLMVIWNCLDLARRDLRYLLFDGLEFQHIVPHDADMEREIEGDDNPEKSRSTCLIMHFFSNPRKPMILALARPDPKKNITTLVKAFGECKPLRELANLWHIPNTTSSMKLLTFIVLQQNKGSWADKEEFFCDFSLKMRYHLASVLVVMIPWLKPLC